MNEAMRAYLDGQRANAEAARADLDRAQRRQTWPTAVDKRPAVADLKPSGTSDLARAPRVRTRPAPYF